MYTKCSIGLLPWTYDLLQALCSVAPRYKRQLPTSILLPTQFRIALDGPNIPSNPIIQSPIYSTGPVDSGVTCMCWSYVL